MRRTQYHLYLSNEEASIVLSSLVHLKNYLITQGRFTDCVDDVIQKVILSPTKKVRI